VEILKLRGEQTESLLAQPESGMGFQIAQYRTPISLRAWLVFNAEFALEFKDADEVQAWRESSRSAISERELRASAKDASSFYTSFSVATTRSGVGLPPGSYDPTTRPLAPAAHALKKTSKTIPGTIYYRFSAFQNDRRVDPKTGAFSPGTYATTATDKPMAPSGFAAVGRYALPNVLPASFLFTLNAVGGEPISVGTVAPAFGQSGGGVEVFFPIGAQNGLGHKPPVHLPDE
jgi:hypothetical protein